MLREYLLHTYTNRHNNVCSCVAGCSPLCAFQIAVTSLLHIFIRKDKDRDLARKSKLPSTHLCWQRLMIAYCLGLGRIKILHTEQSPHPVLNLFFLKNVVYWSKGAGAMGTLGRFSVLTFCDNFYLSFYGLWTLRTATQTLEQGQYCLI